MRHIELREDVEVKAEALLDALTHTQEEIKPGKFGNTLADVQGIAHTLSS